MSRPQGMDVDVSEQLEPETSKRRKDEDQENTATRAKQVARQRMAPAPVVPSLAYADWATHTWAKQEHPQQTYTSLEQTLAHQCARNEGHLGVLPGIPHEVQMQQAEMQVALEAQRQLAIHLMQFQQNPEAWGMLGGAQQHAPEESLQSQFTDETEDLMSGAAPTARCKTKNIVYKGENPYFHHIHPVNVRRVSVRYGLIN